MFTLNKLIVLILIGILFFCFSFYVGYSYRDYLAVKAEKAEQQAISEKQQEVNLSRQTLNDVINKQKEARQQEQQEINTQNNTTVKEVVKYVKDNSASNDTVDDEFVRIYNESLPH